MSKKTEIPAEAEPTEAKKRFYSAYDRPETEPAPAGSKEEPVYQMRIDMRGRRELEQIGMTNVYDIIQESLEQSKIENIIRRATEGDINAIQQMNGHYIDSTDLPTTLAEAQNFVIKAKAEFDQLPINIRRQFDMNAEQYIASYGTAEWMQIMGITKRSEKTITEPPTITPTTPPTTPTTTGGETQ